MAKLVEQLLRPLLDRTKLWYGPIGSGDKLIKNTKKRGELRDKFNLIGLEMEAAGITNTIAVGVIRRVCDYGDTQKTKNSNHTLQLWLQHMLKHFFARLDQ